MNKVHTRGTNGKAQIVESHLVGATLPGIASLVDYDGSATQLQLADGRCYLYSSTSTATVDGGIVLAATGKGAGRWIGQITGTLLDAAKWYPIDKSGIADTTALLQAAADQAWALGKTLYLSDGNYKTTYGLSIRCTVRSSFYAQLKPTGSGYWAVTTHTDTAFSHFSLKINGGNNALHGIKIDRAVLSKFSYLRVEDCVGTGVEISRSYDNVFSTISVERCGSATNYALAITNGGDTCNMSVIHRLQVEHANQLAIYVSPDTLNFTIHNIHSERAYVTDSIKDTWFLAGASSTYNNLRLNAVNDGTSNDAFARAYFYGAGTTVHDGRIEGNIPVTGESAGSGSYLYLNNCLIPNFARSANNKIYITGGQITNLTGNTNDLILENVAIINANPGFTPNANFPLILRGCTITSLNSSSTNTIIILDDCDVNGGSLSQGRTICFNCRINTNIAVSYRALELRNGTVVTGNVTTDTGYLGLFSGSKIVGNLTIGANRQFICDGSSFVTGTVSGFGSPDNSAYADGFSRGQRTWNPAPASGQPEYYVCTTAGTAGAPGTWTAGPTL